MGWVTNLGWKMKSIELTNGGVAIVDDEDYEYLSQWKWQQSNGYAVRCEYLKGRKNKIHRMHRIVNNTPVGLFTDHINRDKLDNRRSNLRNCTYSQNAANVNKRNNGSRSDLPGVQWRADRKKWRSYICVNGRDIYLGTFNDELDAHIAYLNAKVEYFGEFAL